MEKSVYGILRFRYNSFNCFILILIQVCIFYSFNEINIYTSSHENSGLAIGRESKSGKTFILFV